MFIRHIKRLAFALWIFSRHYRFSYDDKKYVYEKKELTLSELVAALDNNFKDSEALRMKLRSGREKCGNNKDRPDAIAADIVNFIVKNPLAGEIRAMASGTAVFT